MPRMTLRTLLAIVSVALLAAVPALAHRGDKRAKTVGTIVSYTDGTLVVSSGGIPVSGLVTRRTEIRWDKSRGWHHGRDHGFFARSSRHGDDDGPGHDVNDDRGGAKRRADDSAGGLPTGGGMPTGGGLPTGGGMPGGLPKPITGLTAGGIVTEAELKLTPSGPVWKKIRLARPATLTPAG